MNKKFSDAAVEAAMEAHRVEKFRWCIVYDDVARRYMISRRNESGEYDYKTIDRLGTFPSDLGACRDKLNTEREIAAMRAALEAAEVVR